MAAFRTGLLRGLALSAGRHVGRARHQLRGVLGPCRAHRSLPVRSERAAARSRTSRCRNAPTRSGTAICRTRSRVCSTAIARYGPYEPQHGHRFNPHKLLLDPYARALVGELRWSDALFGYRVELAARRSVVRPARQRARMAKAVVTDDSFQLGRRPAAAHAVVATRSSTRRMCAGLTHAARDMPRRTSAARSRRSPIRTIIEHLRRLGITAIELLPVHAFVQDRFLAAEGPAQLLGLQHARLLRAGAALSGDRAANEMRVAVRRLHAAGIEVILDVVYNHTAEGNEIGPTLSLPRARQRELLPPRRRTIRATASTTPAPATRSTSPSARPADGDGLAALLGARRSMSMDFASISAATLGREAHGFDPGARFLRRAPPGPGAVAREADRRAVGHRARRLSARPLTRRASPNGTTASATACAASGGAIRAQRPETAARLAGSADIFDHAGRRPWASVNYVTCHDGFTLADLVSLRAEAQRGERRGQPRRRRTTTGRATGASEGPTDDPAIKRVRARVQPRDAGDAVLLRRHADAAGRRRVRAQPAGQQQCLLPGQCSYRGSTGARPRRTVRFTAFVARADRAASRASGVAGGPFPDGAPRDGGRRARHRRGSTNRAGRSRRRHGTIPRNGRWCCAAPCGSLTGGYRCLTHDAEPDGGGPDFRRAAASPCRRGCCSIPPNRRRRSAISRRRARFSGARARPGRC